MPLPAPRVMPRLAFSVKLAAASKVPPFKTRLPAVALPGTAPRSLSAAITSVPADTVVPPLKVLLPDRFNTEPAPICVTLPVPLITWLTVVVLPLAWLNAKLPLFTMLLVLAMEPFTEPLPNCKVPAVMVVTPV